MTFAKHLKKIGGALLVAIVCITAVTSCASRSTATAGSDSFSFTSAANAYKYAQSKGYSQSAKILKDETVTPDEYRSAEASYETCLTKQGYTFGPVVIDPVGGLRLVYEGGGSYQGPQGKADNKAINRCQDVFDTVEETYTLSHTQRMDPQLMASVQACLRTDDFSFSRSATNVKELTGGASSIPTPVSTCITNESHKIFPKIPGVAIGY